MQHGIVDDSQRLVALQGLADIGELELMKKRISVWVIPHMHEWAITATEAIKLSNRPNTATKIIHRSVTLLNTIKCVLKFFVAFNEEYGFRYLDAPRNSINDDMEISKFWSGHMW